MKRQQQDISAYDALYIQTLSLTLPGLNLHLQDTIIRAEKNSILAFIAVPLCPRRLRAQQDLTLLRDVAGNPLKLQSKPVEVNTAIGEPHIILAVIASSSLIGRLSVHPRMAQTMPISPLTCQPGACKLWTYQIRLQSVGVSSGQLGSVTTKCMLPPEVAQKSLIWIELSRLMLLGAARTELAARMREARVNFMMSIGRKVNALDCDLLQLVVRTECCWKQLLFIPFESHMFLFHYHKASRN